MLTRYMGISPRKQSYLFTFALVLNLLGMVLTDLWLPMVVGAIIMTGLTVEAWIRVQHIIPMKKDLNDLHKQIKRIQSELRQVENVQNDEYLRD
ncbi:hypothetical protein VST7929_02725 [Vibrio stylophorae]|uniref:NADH dehydrogenase n=1 Tax=Vibrio stylophorae TaxID=659351 RepID=A0ABN8DY43_9VIBR|nr:hypothetical protein [Vibrio stylophorae]CAH0534763.1 hypothetical protein VST7929_02725 [Vibrio stylophorae]